MDWTQLYYQNPYLKEHQATIIACFVHKDHYEIVCDQTIFYPEGGGQPGDTGYLNDVVVYDTQIKDGTIYHYTKSPLPSGTRVDMKLDFARRFSFMQNHTGEHIFSGLVHQAFGYDNVGFHMGKDSLSLDFNGKLSKKDVAKIEQEVNDIIVSNIQVESLYVDGNSKIMYRSKKPLDGTIRLIKVEGADCCACCGVHVSQTGEIGICKVLDVIVTGDKTRVEVVFGNFALPIINQVYEENRTISQLLCSKVLETSSFVEKLLQEKNDLSKQVNGLMEEYMMERIKHVEKQPLVILQESFVNNDILRKACNQLVEENQAQIAVGLLKQEVGVSLILLSKNYNMNELFKLLQEEMPCKGGGSSDMVQGKLFEDVKDLELLIEKCVNQVMKGSKD